MAADLPPDAIFLVAAPEHAGRYTSEATWSRTRVNRDDVEYRRAPPLAAPAPSAMATGEDVAGQWARMNEALGVRAVSDAELDAVFPPGELDSVYLLLNAHGHPIKAFDTYVECQRALADARRLMGCGYSTTSVRRATPPAAPAAVTDSAEFRMVYEESKAMAGELAKRIRLMEWMETRLRLFDTFASSRTCKNVDAAMASRFGESDAQLRALAAAASAERGA